MTQAGPYFITPPTPWDVIVVGSGATGGWAALQLQAAGLAVLILEAGPDVPDGPDANRFADRLLRKVDQLGGRRPVQSSVPAYWLLNPDLFVLDTEHPIATPEDRPFHWIRSRVVGGRLRAWGGIGVRMSDFELAAAESDGFGEPWPLRYADLAPHYDAVDRFLPVYGEHDGIPQLPDGQYVGAPRLTNSERRFREAVAAKYPDRHVIASRGVLARESSRPGGEPAPPSPLRAAVQGGAHLRANAVVSHITIAPDGRATGVAFYDRLTKRSHEVLARSVALCASTLESTRILLNSRSAHHPNGLGNSSGVVGSYLMDHPAVSISGFAPGHRDVPWTDGTGGPKNIMIPRSQNLGNGSGADFLRGYGVFGSIGRHPGGRRQRPDCDPDEVPFALVAYGEMLPRAENKVSLDQDALDAWGIPTLHIECAYSDNERAMLQHMVESVTEMIEVAGGRVVGDPWQFTPGGFIHETGTARMGTDPEHSVVNGFGQCWDVPNVYVMDGAAFASSGWQNPTFTMMAIAGRASAHLADQLFGR